MYFLYHLLALIITFAFVFKLLTANKNFVDWLRSLDHSRSYSYKQEPTLFSHSERIFFGVLEQVLGSDYKVFGKVHAADLLEPRDRVVRQAALSRITGKHVDFVVCDAEDLSIIGVIELGDNSRHRYSRRKRDAFVDSAFASAELPVLHFPATAPYTLSAVREAIRQQFNITIEEPGEEPLKRFISPKVTYLCDYNRSAGTEPPAAKR